MTPLLFVAADPREFSGWVSRWDAVRELPLAVNWARMGKWKGRPVAAIANGAGPERAFAAVLLAGEVSGVCNIGFCGALDESLRIGDIVVGTQVRNGTRTYQTHPVSGPPACSGPVASISHIAQTATEKKNLAATGATVVEMEAAGAARASEDRGVPFYCVRAVSDLALEDFANDFNAVLTSDGTFHLGRLLLGACTSPKKRLGELIRLQQRTNLAARKLGDFLADCSF